MTGGKIHPLIKCHHLEYGVGLECGGDLLFSHEIVDKDTPLVYICNKCGKRTIITINEVKL